MAVTAIVSAVTAATYHRPTEAGPTNMAGTTGSTTHIPASRTRTAAHQAALHLVATAKVTTDRNRHRPRKIKSSQPFGHAPADITTATVPAQLHVCGTPAA